MLLQLITNFWPLILSSIACYIVYYVVNYYIKVFKHPRGPFPLPVLGNILLFRGTKDNVFITIANLAKQYGPVYSLWLGNDVSVVVSDLDLVKEAFNSKKNEFMGRPDVIGKQFITQGDGSDVVFADHGPLWASLRRVAHSAVRKLAVSHKLAETASKATDLTVTAILEKHADNKPFNPVDYIYFTVVNILASSAFGKNYTLEDKEFNYFKDSLEFFRANNEAMLIVDRIPITKLFYYKKFKAVENCMIGLSKTIRSKYREHTVTHQKGVVNDFCDALIEAKEEAISEDKESAPYLNDKNLSLIIFDLFFAGSDKTQYTMRWIILLMANYPEMQLKMREEIERQIGDRMPEHDDRNSCNYVYAFILETLRLRPIAPLSVPHRAMIDGSIGGKFIAKDALVSSMIWNIHTNPKYWNKPEQFNPNRFIEADGTVNAKNNAYVPFGIGRRACLGEKLALADLFLITVRYIQKIKGYRLELPNGAGTADLEPNPNILALCSPKPYKIVLKRDV